MNDSGENDTGGGQRRKNSPRDYKRGYLILLIFKIMNQTLELDKNSARVVADSVEYLKARFYFSSDWLGCNKYALFYLPEWENPKQVTIADNVCEVPAEVLVAPGFEVSVYGAKGETHVITTEKVRIEVRPSGLKEGSPPLPPPKNLYETVQVTVDEAKRVVEEISGLEDHAVDAIEKKEKSAISNIGAVEANALTAVSNAGMTNSNIIFNKDGSITEITTAYTSNTVFNEDGTITETFSYVNGSKKVRETRFEEDRVLTEIKEIESEAANELGGN